jgi:hypothetical protein
MCSQKYFDKYCSICYRNVTNFEVLEREQECRVKESVKKLLPVPGEPEPNPYPDFNQGYDWEDLILNNPVQ